MSLRNFKLTLEYDGTDFSGWQTQAEGLRTIQNHLEENLEKIFKKKIHCQASGRTDCGVHARAQVAHFKADTNIKTSLIQKALNTFLDRDLSVVKIREVSLDFHAQKNVKSKTYRYTILNRPYPSALWRDRAYFYPHKLNLSRMRKVANGLKGTHDFKPYQSASQRSRIKNTIRTVKNLNIAKEKDLIHITITADGFLYKMVRNITGALIAAGNGQKPARTAPSHGLCLMSVRY
jgi:tRNA pseudouridine38-40 synthase